MDTIEYKDFAKLDLRVATILEVKPHPDADKLLVLRVQIGEEQRQIVAGIKKQYEELMPSGITHPLNLVGKQVVVVTNLEPRTLRGETSHGMLLAASDIDGNLALIQPDKAFASGSKVS
jgi:methionine--tRNA ligase beta chain